MVHVSSLSHTEYRMKYDFLINMIHKSFAYIMCMLDGYTCTVLRICQRLYFVYARVLYLFPLKQKPSLDPNKRELKFQEILKGMVGHEVSLCL